MATASTPALASDPLQLRRRLALQGGGFALLLLTAFAAAVYWGIAGERQADLRGETRQLAATAASQLPLISHEFNEVGNARKFRKDREVVALPGRRLQRVQWFDGRGRLIEDEGSLDLPPQQISARSQWRQWPGGLALWQPVFTRRRAGVAEPPQLAGYVYAGLSDRSAVAELQRLRRGLLLGGIVAVLIALVLGRRMLRAAFGPLQRQVEALERFTADASHELRQPLTLLRTLLASAPQPASALLLRLDAVAAEMAQLLNDLLFLARQDQGVKEGASAQAGWRRFDLTELLDDVILQCQAQNQADGRGVRLRLEGEPCSVWGQPEQLQRLFTNLLLNALRVSPPQGVVQLQLRVQAGRVRVEVRDGGPGIAPLEQSLVFERFWRGQSSPSLEESHSGLGLPIARAIARRHGGELSLASGEPGACCFLVDLPAA